MARASHGIRSASDDALPQILSAADLLGLDVPTPDMLIDRIVPMRGASLIVGAAKSGKTLLAVQMALAVASGRALFGVYTIQEPGPTLIIEQDDLGGAGSIKTILERSEVSMEGIPFYFTGQVPFEVGPELVTWLVTEITKRSLRLIVVDSYTALRATRSGHIDIVKAEQSDLGLLDQIAKEHHCAIVVIHHTSKGSAGLDWAEKAAGTFAMSAATEAQIHISRFRELEGAAPERLVRVRGRHSEDVEMVLRFRKESLDYEHVLSGAAAPLYPELRQLQATFGVRSFGVRELCHATGISRSGAYRLLERLCRADVLRRQGYGEYVLMLT